MRLFFIALTTAALVTCSAGAFAAPATNTNVAAKESPWTMSCQPDATDGKVNCAVTKQLATQDGTSLIAQISVFKNGQDLMMRVIAPHQLNIAAGLGIFIDDRDAGTKPFTTSLPAGIVALFVLDDSILPIIRKGQVSNSSPKPARTKTSVLHCRSMALQPHWIRCRSEAPMSALARLGLTADQRTGQITIKEYKLLIGI